jgi:hypothetical protein
MLWLVFNLRLTHLDALLVTIVGGVLGNLALYTMRLVLLSVRPLKAVCIWSVFLGLYPAGLVAVSEPFIFNQYLWS